MGSTTIKLSHLDKELFPREHITKGDLVGHYKAVGSLKTARRRLSDLPT